ncbi:hypothetical protein BDV37DRAFT_277613 [Aspergillus pseudonomiae]|uniref:Zn(2)-C6 fungal-type domain-containing protein n=1 Tax=Aspergillus pseudonomiae TaxID=1506151 RepID=A0A5N7DUK1_9EURO|nr:uncharacterized protein BDV37DRAFT_277613 [Aspergillus pseudonomiae]KAE8409965.1 hypothetical protein BDV37DRAFT_277613 [Aspergillus pseudonomiae]
MTPRLAACEACRKSKLACDHKRPACTRCRNANRVGMCVYRAAPFKRKRTQVPSPSAVELSESPRSPGPLPVTPTLRRRPYPNPGYLGFSSHVSIFNHIAPDGDSSTDISTATMPGYPSESYELTQRAADALSQFFGTFPLEATISFVNFWLATGINLALAGPFVKHCAQTMNHLLPLLSHKDWHLVYARQLLQNSAKPLQFNHESNFASFSAQFFDENARWETIGIFFVVVSRATLDVPYFPSLYLSEKEQYALRRSATKLSDCALEISLSLDCLNDLQLIFQYENFIVHSHVDGDQSYHSWRRLGDAIASTFALGYHENIENKPDLPPFLIELRKLASARLYSADKNIAIFLGRPPRMSKRFCHFQLSSSWAGFDSDAPEHITAALQDAKASYKAETRWSALCASLKEEIMEMFCDNKKDTFTERASVIQEKAETYWEALPPQFRLEGSLKQCTQNPFERDFVAAVRLNHLHVLFLLRLLLLNTPAEPDMPITEVAQQMMSLVVESILVRDQLVNSGTALVWRVAHYGLPAAGIILLAMLRQQDIPSLAQISWTRAVQDLTVFVAEVEAGSFIKQGDPNYALLSKASQTIRRFIDTVQPPVAHRRVDESWTGFLSQDPWDFEYSFWENLADHPSLDSLPTL